jgi:hypothetical protein
MKLNFKGVERKLTMYMISFRESVRWRSSKVFCYALQGTPLFYSIHPAKRYVGLNILPVPNAKSRPQSPMIN